MDFDALTPREVRAVPYQLKEKAKIKAPLYRCIQGSPEMAAAEGGFLPDNGG